VLEERRSRTDNDPAAQLHEAVQATLYFNHPYRIPIIGWKHEIETLTTKDALSFYRRFYVPNNAILIVAGDVTADQLRPLAEKYYGPIEKGAAVQRRRVKEPPHLAARRVELQSARVGLARWSRTFIAPSYRTAEGNEAYALQVLAETIGGSSLSRLYRTLVVEQGVASSVGVWYSPNHLDTATFDLAVTPRSGTDIAVVEAALLAEIERLLKDGVTEAEIARAKRSLVAGAVYARDSLATAPNVIGSALATGSTIEDVEAWPDRIAAVTVDQVNDAARSVLVPAHSVTGVLRPHTLARK
jgi:zinc protease